MSSLLWCGILTQFLLTLVGSSFIFWRERAAGNIRTKWTNKQKKKKALEVLENWLVRHGDRSPKQVWELQVCAITEQLCLFVQFRLCHLCRFYEKSLKPSDVLFIWQYIKKNKLKFSGFFFFNFWWLMKFSLFRWIISWCFCW